MLVKGFEIGVIIIIDLTYDDDRKSGRRIDDAIFDSINITGSNLERRYVKCQTHKDFFNVISSIKNDIINNDLYPMIHIEGHGSQDAKALCFPNDKNLNYARVIKCFREINILCNNNLFVTSGACKFAYSLTRDISISKPCAVFGMLAPEQIITDLIMEQGFLGFYNTFIQTGGCLISADKEFLKYVNGKDYSLILSESLFDDSVKNSLFERFTGKSKYITRESLLTTCMKFELNRLSVNQTRKLIKSKSKPISFNVIQKNFKIFLMAESCNNNMSRFNLYEKNYISLLL